MICGLRRDLSDQRISESYNVLLGDLSHRVIRALAEKLQKLRKTAAIKSHRRWSSLRLLAIKPIVQKFAQARLVSSHNSFTGKLLMQSIQNRLCLPQTPLCPRRLFVFIRESLRLLPVSFFRRDSTLTSSLIPKTHGKILRI